MDAFDFGVLRLVGFGGRKGRFFGGRSRSRPWLAAALAALAAFATPDPAAAAGRAALVMVGEDYQKLPLSGIGVRRANEVAQALQSKGFSVLVSVNPVNARARAILLDFSQKAKDADLALAFLMGHVVALGGDSYFMPVNTELRVSTDLFSRGISVSSVARIVGKAKAGAVIVLMTTPNFATEVPGVDVRPQYAAETPKSVVTVFSSSARLPVSRIDAASEQAADAVANLLRRPAPGLADLVKAASADVGSIFGAAADIGLAQPSPAQNLSASGAQAASAQAGRISAGAGAAATIDEDQLGESQCKLIQQRLTNMHFYSGPVDSIMGRLTRKAIMSYQRSKGVQATGYLTREQAETLLTNAD
jgi:hypothetical protein